MSQTAIKVKYGLRYNLKVRRFDPVLHQITYFINKLYFSVDVTTALINWQGLCEAHQLDPINTLADAPEILYVPIEVTS